MLIHWRPTGKVQRPFFSLPRAYVTIQAVVVVPPSLDPGITFGAVTFLDPVFGTPTFLDPVFGTPVLLDPVFTLLTGED